MTDNKEFAKQMRKNAVKNEQGNIVCTPELWEEIASVIERAIIPPCKVGDFVWFVFTPKYPANPNDKGKWFMRQDGVQRIIFGAKGLSIETWNMGTIPAKELGKKIFLTKEEAEKALKEREGK